ncbi:hypothetical protein Efla_003990 [Eimeria flavescens]
MTPGTGQRTPSLVNILKQYPVDDPTRTKQNGEVTSEVVRASSVYPAAKALPGLRGSMKVTSPSAGEFGGYTGSSLQTISFAFRIQTKIHRGSGFGPTMSAWMHSLLNSLRDLITPRLRPRVDMNCLDTVYVQFKPVARRFFVMHFDLNTSKRMMLRITLTNLVKKPKVLARVIQYPLLPPSRWVQACLHIPSLLGQFTKLSPTGNTLVSIQICSSLYLRGIFTSDVLYTTNDLPRDLRLHEVYSSRPSELLPWVYVPIGCRSSECNQINCSSTDSSTPELPEDEHNLSCTDAQPLTEPDKHPGPVEPNAGLKATLSTATSAQLLTERRPAADLFGVRAVLQADQVSGVCRPAQLRKCGALWVGESRILSCHSSILLYRNLQKKTSRCLLGHIGVIEVLEVSPESALAATVNNEPHQPCIRIWRLPAHGSEVEDVRCTAIIQSATVERISLLRLDPRGRYMVLVGSDRIGRQQLQVWELQGLLTTGRAALLARQVSDFQIEALRISPLEELHIVSCGKENIRFWRIKNGHLPGCNVSLDGLGRGNVFTDLAFAFPHQPARSPMAEDRAGFAKLFVSSTCGSVLEVDYFTRAVKRVFPLHQSPIWAVAAGLGFCVTASADKVVKVWPLNFVTAYLSAEHGEECVGIDVSPDGQQVLCTCADSACAVRAGAMRELYTVCEDGLVRVWTLPDLQQTFEMESPQDPPLHVAAHPTQRVLALGFKSGAVRVLAVEGPAVWMEANHHRHPIAGLWFTDVPSSAADPITHCVHKQPPLQQQTLQFTGAHGGCSEISSRCSLVISLDASGCLCIFSQLHEFALIRVIENPVAETAPDGVSPLSFAADGSRAARYVSSRKLAIFRLPSFTFEEELSPLSTACRSVVITAFSFSAAADALCVCGSDSTMRLLSLPKEVRPACSSLSYEWTQHSRLLTNSIIQRLLVGTSSCIRLSREVALLSGPISTAWVSCAGRTNAAYPQVALTCGADGLIKVWNLARSKKDHEVSSTKQAERGRDNWQEVTGSNNVSASAQKDRNPETCISAVSSPSQATYLKPDFPEFQSFAGHNRPPFLLQLLGEFVVTVSPTETIVWRVGSPLLSAAADAAPSTCTPVAPPTIKDKGSSRLSLTGSALMPQPQEMQDHLQAHQASRRKTPPDHPPQQRAYQPLQLGRKSAGLQQQNTLCSPRILTPPKRAPMPTVATAFPEHAARYSASPDKGTAAASSAEIEEEISSSVKASIDPESARSVPPTATADNTATEALECPSASLALTATEEIVSQRSSADGEERNLIKSSCTKEGHGDADEMINEKTCEVPVAQVFKRANEVSAAFGSTSEQEQPLAISTEPESPGFHMQCLLRRAAARHVVGLAVTGCRNSCFWRPSSGVLAHAVGKWVIIEKLGSQAIAKEGRCLGLLPALLKTRSYMTMRQEGAPASSVVRSASSAQCAQQMFHHQQLQILQQSAALAHKPPNAVLKHPLVGQSIAFSLDTTARLAATISVLQWTRECSPYKKIFGSIDIQSRMSLGDVTAEDEDDTPSCWGLCVWMTEGGGELLAAARLPRGYGDGKALYLEKRRCFATPSDDSSVDLPAVLFCGPDLIVTAGGFSGSRLDVWRVADFITNPSCIPTIQMTEDTSLCAMRAAADNSTSCNREGCCTNCSNSARPSEHSLGGPTPAVGADVGTPLKRLLSAASGDEREAILVSSRSVTLWRVVRADGSPIKTRSNCYKLQLQFQFAEQPSRVRDDQLESYTTACLTRRAKNTPRLLLVASDRGWVYGYDYDANVFVFELRVDENPIDCISCGKALYLAFTTASFARRTTVDLQRILENQHYLVSQRSDAAVGLKLQAASQITDLRLAAVLALRLRYLHWDQRAQVRLHASHKLPIRHVAVSSQASQPIRARPRLSYPKSKNLAPKARLDAAGLHLQAEPLFLATADDGGSLRIWSRWPVPQQMADFSMQLTCMALSFLWPTLLLGSFSDGAIRLFELRAFRIIGRLQLSVPQDPPVAIACLGDRHVLLATASGEMLSLILDLSLRSADDTKGTAGPEIKHASVSRITSAVMACFGPTFTRKKPASDGASSGSFSSCVCNTNSVENLSIAVECLVGQRHAISTSGKANRAAFALCLSGGYCSIGAYAKTCGDGKWILCSASCFGVRFGPEEGCPDSMSEQDAVCLACFPATGVLIVARGTFLFVVDCIAQQASGAWLEAELHNWNGLPSSCCALGPPSVAALCCPREDTAAIITNCGQLLLIEVATLRLAGVVHQGVHPHLPRSKVTSSAKSISLAASAEAIKSQLRLSTHGTTSACRHMR